jgi:hypothetical protein
MFPWLWIYAPQVYGPLSGAVTQDVTTAFFRGIKPGAGSPQIEREVFDQASYGKQLGLLMDIIVGAIDEAALRTPEARESFAKLKVLHAQVQRIKDANRPASQ